MSNELTNESDNLRTRLTKAAGEKNELVQVQASDIRCILNELLRLERQLPAMVDEIRSHKNQCTSLREQLKAVTATKA